MDTKNVKPLVQHIVNILVILAMAFSVTTVVHAASTSPFIGTWFGTDIDGSGIRLVIAGNSSGPFQITWTDTYISFCNGGAGIIRGTGWLNENDSNLLEADMHLECFTTGAILDFHTTWRYHASTNTLSNTGNGYVTIWSRLRKPASPPPNLNLRVNYGDNWVESFYETGHTAWITVFGSDGVTIKAWAELITEPKEYWNWEPGFQSMDSSWYDGDGNLMDNPPDIQAYDWVYGWVDNGATARVQIGDITGVVDLPTDTIEGTIYTPWFSTEVNIECFPWGAPQPQPEMKYDAVQPDGVDPYHCSWSGEWDIGFGQTVGVGYSGPDGHWVANSFRNTYFTAFPENEYVEGFFWTLSANVHLSIDDPATDANPDFEQDQTVVVTPWDPNTTWVTYSFADTYDMKPGDVVTLSDGITTRTHTIQNLAVTNTSALANTVSGTADTGTIVSIWVHEWYNESQMTVSVADGRWTADFNSVGFDLKEGMCGRTAIGDEYANATAVDWCVRNPRFTIFSEWNTYNAWDWLEGASVSITVEGKPECDTSGITSNNFLDGSFPEGCDITSGDAITFMDGETTRTHTVQNLAITHTDATTNTVTGTADPDTQLNVWVHEHGEYAVRPTSDGDGNWTADFGAVGFDLVENMCGRAEIPDEFGNATAIDWCVPNPRFTIFPDSNWYDAMDWSDGVTVTITVEGKPECATSGVSSGNFFNGGFPESCDIVIGDVLTFTDGETIRTHTVRNLAITDIDKTANTVSGTADPDAQLNVWVHEHGEYAVQPIADGDGNWTADFGAVGLDLVENMCGRAAIGDEYGNSTAIDWCIPNPRFTIFPEWNWYDAMDWSDDVTVSISVEGKPECDTSGVSSDNFFNGGFPETCDVVVGDVLTFTDGETIRTHTVRNLAITDADAAVDTVAGRSDPDEHLNLFAYDSEISVQPTADEYGNWTADFASAGLDLVEGMGGRAEISDEYGNATSVEWIVSVKYDITNTEDVTANDGICTLREAIIAANTNSPSGDIEGECPAGLDYGTDVIILSADQTYSLTKDSTYENSSLDGDLDIWDNSVALELILKVNEGGSATISQNATVDDRVLENWASIMIESVTFTGGSEGGSGGGILNHGSLKMNTCTVSSSTAGWSGGGLFNEGTLEATNSAILNNVSMGTGGGGISNEGTMTLIGSTISGNTGSGDGGGFTNNGNLLIDSSILSGNSAPGKGGGALANFYGGMVTIQNGTDIHENTAGTGGGLFNYGSMTVKDSAVADNSADFGGGISVWAGTLTVNNSTVTGNISANHGGGIHNVGSATTIIENGSLISGNTATWNGGGIDMWDNGTVTISNSTISNNTGGGSGGGLTNENSGILTLESNTIIGNTAANDGGGIANWATLNITNSLLSNNHAVWGGGMITTGGVVTLDSGTISSNTADADAGGIFIKDSAVVTIQNGSQITANEAAWGGGISSWASTLTIDGSTLSGNTAVNGGGGILVHDGGKAMIQNGSLVSGNFAMNGGGIANWGPSEMEINSSTVTGNAATGEAGGGVWNSGIMTVSNSSISTNSAINGGGGIFNWYGGVLTVETSTLDMNTAGWGAGMDNFPDGVVTVNNSIISGNQAENLGGGLLNWSGSLTVTGSAIQNNTAAGDGDAVDSSTTSINGTTVTNSCIVGNGILAAFNEQTISQDFTLNWWGDPSGPGGFGPGSGDTVGLNIDFSEWLLTPPSICAP